MTALTAPQILGLVLNALSLLVFAFILPVLRHLRELRQNELHKLQESLDRIEAKIDRHLEWHAENR